MPQFKSTIPTLNSKIRHKQRNDGKFDPQELARLFEQDELEHPLWRQRNSEEAAVTATFWISRGNDENLSIKAAYLVGYISGQQLNEILKAVWCRGIAPVRIAAAFGAQSVKPKSQKAIPSAILRKNNEPFGGEIRMAIRIRMKWRKKNFFKSKIDQISKNFLTRA